MPDFTPKFLTRFWSKVDKTGTCWLWMGEKLKGYGRIRSEHKNHKAHRISYTLVKGSIPEGLELDHLCRNRACVNPDHLEPVTHKENMRRSVHPKIYKGGVYKAKKKHDTKIGKKPRGKVGPYKLKVCCKQGHELTEDNILLIDAKTYTYRKCKTCYDLYQEAYKIRRRSKVG